MGELTDLYDETGKRNGKTMYRGEKPGPDDYIQASAAIVQAGDQILVTKRHPNKTQGGMWEFPGGGSKAGEEPLETLFRELEEETGICAGKDQVTFLNRVYFAPYHLFLYVYLVRSEVTLQELHLQETEISDGKFVTLQELSKMQEVMTKMDWQIYEEVLRELFQK